MKDFLKDKWVLLLVLFVFIACKIPHLSYAYYWDECWPYASAIRAMWHHGISLMPNAIDTELSRGHPLLFHVLAAGWMKVFGGSHIAMHSFSLLISVILLVSVFEIGTRLFNQRVGVLALLLIATQEVFFVQSSFVMLEVPLALFCLLSLYFYIKGKALPTVIFLSAAFFTKESGLVMGIVLGIDAFIRLFDKSEDRKASYLRLLAVAVPCILIAGFFLVQKHIHGWYIFPDHANLIEHDWNNFWYRFRMVCVNDVFNYRMKFYYFLLLLVMAVIATAKNKKIHFLSVFIPAYFIYYFVDDMRAGRILPSIPFFTLFVIGWCYALWLLSRIDSLKNSQRGRLMILAGSFVLLFLCFSGMNFYTYRYMLACIIPMLIILAILLDSFIAQSFQPLYYVAIIAIGIIGYFSFKENDHFGDTDRGAFDAMYVQQSVVDELERQGDYDKKIAVGSYLERIHLTDPTTGFLKGDRVFANAVWLIESNTEFVIFDNIESDNRHDSVKTNPLFQLAYRVERGRVWAEIYKRK